MIKKLTNYKIDTGRSKMLFISLLASYMLILNRLNLLLVGNQKFAAEEAAFLWKKNYSEVELT